MTEEKTPGQGKVPSNEGTGGEPEEDILAQFNTPANERKLEALLQQLLDAKDRLQELADAEDAEKLIRDNAQQEIIEELIACNLDGFKALGKSVTFKTEPEAYVLIEHAPQQREWLREIGQASMIKEVVDRRTFSGFMRKEYLPSGEPVPDFVKISEVKKLSIVKATR